MKSEIAAPSRWTAGTLTYTLGGIVGLFFLLLAGDFVWSLRERSVGVIAQLLLKQQGASDFLVGLYLVTLPGILGLLVGPVVSYRSDRHRGRWGRRIPYLFFSTPVAFAGMVGMAFTPWLGERLYAWGEWQSFTQNQLILALFGVSWMLFEFGVFIGNAIFTALINDVVPKSLVGRFFGLFRIVSLATGIIFNAWFLGYAETHYMILFLSVGVVYVTGFMLMCFRVREGEYPPLAATATERHSPLGAAVIYLRESFSMSYYLEIFIAVTLAMIVFMPVNTYLIFFIRELHISLAHFGKYTAISYVISMVLSYPLGMLADKYHPLRCGIAVMVLYAVSCICSGLWIATETSFAVALIVHTVLSGTYFTLTASLLLRLFPQTRFAQYQSAQGIFGTCAAITVVPLIGKLIDLSGNYRLIFYAGSGLAFLTAIALLLCYRRFTRYGGPDHYVPPEPPVQNCVKSGVNAPEKEENYRK